jgi:ATPase subunit of ABC transporter with duplicated ATPase domains
MAQSRLKTIAKLEAEGVKAPVLTDGPVPVLVITKPPKGTPQTLLTMENINLAWSEEDANNDKYIVKNANFKIDKNMKIAVRES